MLRRLRVYARVAVALAVLAAVWVGTLSGVEKASERAVERRLNDRTDVGEAVASALGDWFGQGIKEASGLLDEVEKFGAEPAIEGFEPGTFAREAVVLKDQGGDRFSVAATTDPKGTRDVLLRDLCPTAKGRGLDADVVTGASTADEAPYVTGVLTDVPGFCGKKYVGAMARRGASVALVLSPASEVVSRAGTVYRLWQTDGSEAPAGGRAYVLSRSLILRTTGEIASMPPGLEEFVQESEGKARTARTSPSRTGDKTLVSTYAPVVFGEYGTPWAIAFEQSAADFDPPAHEDVRVGVATVLTFTLAVVFLLVWVFDARRRRAHRRAEVAKDEFFSVTGHELRTPLTILKGFSETLSARWQDLDDDRRQMLIDKMTVQSRRLERTLERLILAASIQAETWAKPRVGPLDLESAVEPVIDRFRVEAPLHAFHVAISPSCEKVVAEHKALEQILVNLVDNAVKYSPSGGSIWIKAAPHRRFVVLTVEDEGIGLPSDYKRIFDRFTQGESVTKRVHDEGGTGLGLFVVRTLVEEMGGRVWAERRSPAGARFTVALKPSRARDRAPAAASN